MTNVRLLGVKVCNRQSVAAQVQVLFTKYGSSIRTRLGLNEPGESDKSGSLIVLELIGNINEWEKLEKELLQLEKVEVKRMDFETNVC